MEKEDSVKTKPNVSVQMQIPKKVAVFLDVSGKILKIFEAFCT